MSAVVRVKDVKGNFVEARILLDTCATAHFITEEFAHKLNLPMNSCDVSVGAINSLFTTSKNITKISIFSRYSDFTKSLNFLVIPKIADFVPDEPFPRNSINIPTNIKLADPQFHIPRKVDMLIGSGVTLSLFSVGQINLSRGDEELILQKTQLGWTIAGSLNDKRQGSTVSCNLIELNKQLQKFWEVEEIEIDAGKDNRKSSCEQHYCDNTTRDPNGRYVVRLPFKDKERELGNSRSIALRRFHAMQRRLRVNEIFKLEYSRVLQEYISLGHMTLVQNEDSSGYYMPHHAVIKPSSNTTKIRVVFDASAKTDKGLSLNGQLMIGPTIQDKLFIHLMRFRGHAFVLTADIEKMYRQVIVHPDDRRFQRIFWYHDNKTAVYELNTVTFGVASAPYLAIRSIHQLADDEKTTFPRAAQILKRDLYVDDLLTGANSLDEVLEIRNEIIQLLRRGGFHIRQWASNHQHALDNFERKVFQLDGALEGGAVFKTLGVVWNSETDQFVYTVKQIEWPATLTKRIILSEIARIFDPPGLLGPIILYAKVIMQDCWRLKCDWDESVSQELHSRWSRFANQLHAIRGLNIERRLLIDHPVRIEIHGFCDASRTGYGACIYLRSIDKDERMIVRLACAESRVAPLKVRTIPQLELCGALILVNLLREVRPAFEFAIDRVILWSDSTIVLHWLKRSPEDLKVFEANRVNKIQTLGAGSEWRHVRTYDNPADALSRGQLPLEFVDNQVWQNGPIWLANSESTWPTDVMDTPNNLPGLRVKTCFILSTKVEIFSRFSTYSTLINVIAFCLRFRPKNEYKSQSIGVEERRESERIVLRSIQREQFANEIALLSNSKPAKSQRLAAFDPFLDEHGLLRVGGRLENANISFNQKHPVLLPSRHHVTDLIIREVHLRNFHAGSQTTLATMRQRFWLLDGKNQIRKVVRNCVECIKNRPNVLYSKMGNLPESRVNESAAFERVGIDFFGPVYIKEKKLRNRNKIKAYGCVFVCMASKAVHIEIASDLTTEGFLGGFRRFIARRGIPSHVFSDNGTNFVGANNQLIEMYKLVNSERFRAEVDAFAVRRNIRWRFNPPISPHFGGLWEAAVRSFKHHFRRVVGEQLLTFEQINTLAIEIEAILNSRPLYSLSTDPNDLTAITPAHLLIGRSLNFLPEDDLLSVPGNRLSIWRFISRARQDFWKRWNLEYLNELQRRQRWFSSNHNIDVGSIVLLIDKNQPCMRWRLGIIVKTHPGDDGIIRVVTIKTNQGLFKRNVTHLCPLPTSTNSID